MKHQFRAFHDVLTIIFASFHTGSAKPIAPAILSAATRIRKMLKSLIMSALIAGASLASVAQAGSVGDGLGKWVASVNRQIDQHAQQPDTDVIGTAQLSFRRGNDGRATDVQIQRGQRDVADAAVRTLSELRHLPVLPAGFAPTQRITMNFMIGSPESRAEYEAHRARMLASANASNARLAARATSTQLASIDRR